MVGMHDFMISKMNIDHIWLIDFFGGASNVAVEDYYKATEAARYFAKRAATQAIAFEAEQHIENLVV